MTSKFPSAPTLETERLRLRGWRRQDREAYWAMLEEPAVYQYLGGEAASREENWRRMVAAVGSWQVNGFGGWAVERKSDGKLVGMAALFTAFRALEPEFGDEPEMGWIFATEAHGQGFAGEACRAVLDWADEHLADEPIWAIIATENKASIALAEKLGFEALSVTEYADELIGVYRRDKPAS